MGKAGGGRVAQYPFLSDEWVEAARQIRAEFKGKAPEIPVSVRMNQIIQDVPFGSGTINAHVDTSSGELEMETGHLESPDLTITIGYDTAKAILIDGDAQAAMQAFLGGRIKVDGDITKMLALQSAGIGGGGGVVDPAAIELAKRLQAITA
jgi:putative sterol carrier protein